MVCGSGELVVVFVVVRGGGGTWCWWFVWLFGVGGVLARWFVWRECVRWRFGGGVVMAGGGAWCVVAVVFSKERWSWRAVGC